MVVIAIIGILASVVASSYNSAKEKVSIQESGWSSVK